jgi:hypothetical protein
MIGLKSTDSVGVACGHYLWRIPLQELQVMYPLNLNPDMPGPTDLIGTWLLER